MSIISVVTVCFNAQACIGQTLRSMRDQGQGPWEYIVIDGASTDGTIDEINDNQDIVNTLVVESDRGIYDAMNKGLKIAKGRYIYYLNAGDSFHSAKVLSHLVALMKDSNTSLFYGDIITSTKLIATRNIIKQYFKGMPHQACFFRRDAIEQFDLKFKICADFKQYLELRSEPDFQATHVALVISYYDSIKPDKSPTERLRYDRQRIVEKVMLSYSHLKGFRRVIGIGFYSLHLAKLVLTNGIRKY